jgi:hypothetical protein
VCSPSTNASAAPSAQNEPFGEEPAEGTGAPRTGVPDRLTITIYIARKDPQPSDSDARRGTLRHRPRILRLGETRGAEWHAAC